MKMLAPRRPRVCEWTPESKAALNWREIPVNDFTYLGSKMSNKWDGEMRIRARLAKASQAFNWLRSSWKARNICLKTKLRIFKSNVVRTLLYGSWNMTKTISNKLDFFQNRCLRRILHNILAIGYDHQ
jgi:hypothetical protein